MEASGTALVTGASRGIGRAVALELARRGFDVVATMRDPAAGAGLAEEAGAAGAVLRVERLDVCEPDSIRIPDDLRVLVNNAGVEADYLPVEEAPLSQWRDIFETNVFGLVEVTRRAIPVLRARRGSVICNVTSSSILAPVPFYAAYRASKAAVAALGETLRAELAPFGVRIVEILPGPIETDMFTASERLPEAHAFAPYRAMAEQFLEGRKKVQGITSPARAAEAIADAIQDDGGPLRYGCDGESAAMLEAWRAASDEQFAAPFMTMFVEPGGR